MVIPIWIYFLVIANPWIWKTGLVIIGLIVLWVLASFIEFLIYENEEE